VINKRIALLIYIVVLAVSVIFTHSFTGVRLEQHNGEYLFQTGSSSEAVLVSVFMIPFTFLYKTKGKPKISNKPITAWRRFLAFLIDFSMALAIISPILALPALLVEWQNTNSFSWHFTRDWPRHSDSFDAMIGVILTMIWILIYLSFPLVKGKQTFGQLLMGYRISDFMGRKITFKRAILRNICGFVVLCMWPITLPMAHYHPKKYMLHDNEDGLRPERLVYEQ